MKPAVQEQYYRIAWKSKPDPVIKPDEVLIQIAYASICGIDQPELSRLLRRTPTISSCSYK